MFVLTLNRRLLKRVALAAGCGVVLAGAVFALNGHFNRDTAQTASVQPAASTHMESTQDMASFFTAYGLEMDPATVTMDKVKVPRSWDESFTAFNAEIEKCGLSLQNYKGKTVEKWMMLSPSASAGDQKTYGVMLVYKKEAVGAYMLQQPSGEVTDLTTASAAAAPLETVNDPAVMDTETADPAAPDAAVQQDAAAPDAAVTQDAAAPDTAVTQDPAAPDAAVQQDAEQPLEDAGAMPID